MEHVSMSTKVTLQFPDGAEKCFELKHVTELDLKEIRDMSMTCTNKGWRMLVTEGFLHGHKLAEGLTIQIAAEGPLQPYMVHLLYPDYMAETFGHDDFATTVMASSPEDAFARAVAEVKDSHPDELNDDNDMHVLGIYEGRVKDVNPYRNQ